MSNSSPRLPLSPPPPPHTTSLPQTSCHTAPCRLPAYGTTSNEILRSYRCDDIQQRARPTFADGGLSVAWTDALYRRWLHTRQADVVPAVGALLPGARFYAPRRVRCCILPSCRLCLLLPRACLRLATIQTWNKFFFCLSFWFFAFHSAAWFGVNILRVRSALRHATTAGWQNARDTRFAILRADHAISNYTAPPPFWHPSPCAHLLIHQRLPSFCWTGRFGRCAFMAPPSSRSWRCRRRQRVPTTSSYICIMNADAWFRRERTCTPRISGLSSLVITLLALDGCGTFNAGAAFFASRAFRLLFLCADR